MAVPRYRIMWMLRVNLENFRFAIASIREWGRNAFGAALSSAASSSPAEAVTFARNASVRRGQTGSEEDEHEFTTTSCADTTFHRQRHRRLVHEIDFRTREMKSAQGLPADVAVVLCNRGAAASKTRSAQSRRCPSMSQRNRLAELANCGSRRSSFSREWIFC